MWISISHMPRSNTFSMLWFVFCLNRTSQNDFWLTNSWFIVEKKQIFTTSKRKISIRNEINHKMCINRIQYSISFTVRLYSNRLRYALLFGFNDLLLTKCSEGKSQIGMHSTLSYLKKWKPQRSLLFHMIYPISLSLIMTVLLKYLFVSNWWNRWGENIYKAMKFTKLIARINRVIAGMSRKMCSLDYKWMGKIRLKISDLSRCDEGVCAHCCYTWNVPYRNLLIIFFPLRRSIGDRIDSLTSYLIN